MDVFERDSGNDKLTVGYYPGMAEIRVLDGWNDIEIIFNMHISDWRAMNVAIERAHGGGYNGS